MYDRLWKMKTFFDGAIELSCPQKCDAGTIAYVNTFLGGPAPFDKKIRICCLFVCHAVNKIGLQQDRVNVFGHEISHFAGTEDPNITAGVATTTRTVVDNSYWYGKKVQEAMKGGQADLSNLKAQEGNQGGSAGFGDECCKLSHTN
jgi:hypothetical protein